MTRADTVSNLVYLLRGILELGRIEQKPRKVNDEILEVIMRASYLRVYCHKVFTQQRWIGQYLNVYERISFRTNSLKDLYVHSLIFIEALTRHSSWAEISLYHCS